MASIGRITSYNTLIIRAPKKNEMSGIEEEMQELSRRESQSFVLGSLATMDVRELHKVSRCEMYSRNAYAMMQGDCPSAMQHLYVDVFF